MGKVVAEFRLQNGEDRVLADKGYLPRDRVRTMLLRGIVDTGAAMLVLPASAAEFLGLPKTGEAGVRYADNRRATRDVVGQCDLTYGTRSGVFNAVVEPGRTEALIGAIVLETLDLLVDCRKQELTPRDPDMIMTEIE